MQLALLDVEGGERFVLSEHDHDLVDPRQMPWEHVAQALEDERAFMLRVAGSRRMRARDIPNLQASWAARNGLVTGDDLTRLLWLARRFRAEIEVDLLQHAGVDLGELWRARRWRLLLNLIDHLPRHAWTTEAMSNDPEHAERVAAAMAAKKKADDDEPWSPPLTQYTPEVEALSALIDAVNGLHADFIRANSSPGAQQPKFSPHSRPVTLVAKMAEKAERKARWSAHEALAARVLPGRKKQT